MTVVANSLDEEMGVLLRCARLNAMPQIHYVSGWPCLLQNLFSALLDCIMVGKENTRVKVSLDSTRTFQTSGFASICNSLSTLCHINSPVQRNDINSSAGHSFDQCTGVLDIRHSWNVWVLGFDLTKQKVNIVGGRTKLRILGSKASLKK